MSGKSTRRNPRRSIHARLYALQELRAWDGLVREARVALAEAPDDGELQLYLAHGLERTGHPVDSLQAATRGLSLMPDSEWAFRQRAQALDALKRYDEALIAGRQALKIAPDEWQVLGIMARCLLRCYLWEELRDLSERMIALYPDSNGSHYYLAVALKNLGDMPGSLHHLEVGLRIQPDSATCRNVLAIHRLRAGQTEVAIRLCVEAVALDPDRAQHSGRLLFCLRQHLVPPPPREGVWIPSRPPASLGPLPAMLHVLRDSLGSDRERELERETRPLDPVPQPPFSESDRSAADAAYQRWREPASARLGELLTLDIPELIANRIITGQYLSARPPLTLDDFVNHWALAAQETARGYRSSRAEFQGDLLLRDALTAISKELPPRLQPMLENTLRPWDELFLEHTVSVEATDATGATGEDGWWRRQPRDAPGFCDPSQD